MTQILIAEDEQDIRELIILSLRLNKMQSVAVKNGALAVEQATTSKFDLVLLDMNMPELNGRDAAQQIRDSELNGDTPILFLTGDPLLESVPVENSSVLSKPFTISRLVSRIRSVLEAAAQP